MATEHGVIRVRVLGSYWTLLPKTTEYFLPLDVAVGLPARKICMHSRTFLYLCELRVLSHCISLKAKVKVSYETTLLFQCGTTCLLYILHVKYIKIISLFWEHFQFWSRKICRPINVFQQAQRGFLSPCYLSSGSKNVNKIQYLGIRAFHIPLRVQMNILKWPKQVCMENTILI